MQRAEIAQRVPDFGRAGVDDDLFVDGSHWKISPEKFVGWAKRSVPTDTTEMMKVGTARSRAFAHPTL
jgi:hypothetical protein